MEQEGYAYFFQDECSGYCSDIRYFSSVSFFFFLSPWRGIELKLWFELKQKGKKCVSVCSSPLGPTRANKSDQVGRDFSVLAEE